MTQRKNVLTSLLLRRDVVVTLIVILIAATIVHEVVVGPTARTAENPALAVFRQANDLILLVTACLTVVSLVLAILQMWSGGRRSRFRLAGPSITLATIDGSRLDDGSRAVSGVLRGAGYRAADSSDGRLVFTIQWFGRWGTLVFHVGLFLIVASFLFRGAFGKRGYLQLVEGDRITVTQKDWATTELGILARGFDLDFEFAVDKIDPEYRRDELWDIRSQLTLSRACDKREVAVSFEKPVRHRGVTIYQTDKYGFVTGFLLQRPGKEPVPTHYLLRAPNTKGEPFVGDFDFPTSPYDLKIRFHPDVDKPSFLATNPGVSLVVTHGGKGVFDGTVLFNRGAPLENGDFLAFTDIAYWTNYIVTTNQGNGIFYAGIALAVAGVCLCYIVFPRVVAVEFVGDDRGRQTVSARFAAPFPARFPTHEQKALEEKLRLALKEFDTHVMDES